MRDSALLLRVLVLLELLLTGSAACTQRELVGPMGGSVTFPLCSFPRQLNTVVWTFNTTSLVTLQHSDNHDIVIVSQKQKESRMRVVQGNYSLVLSRLELGDAGSYRVELHSSDQPQPLTHEYTLRVYDHLPRPTVASDPQLTEDGICLLNLTCSVLPGAAVTYSWEVANGTREGSVLPVSWRPGNNDQHFTCVATNPVSSNSSHPVSAKELCEGATPHAGLLVLWLPLAVLLCCAAAAAVAVVLLLRRQTPPAPTEGTTGLKTVHYSRMPAGGDMHNSALCVLYTFPEDSCVYTLYSTAQIPKKSGTKEVPEAMMEWDGRKFPEAMAERNGRKVLEAGKRGMKDVPGARLEGRGRQAGSGAPSR